MQKLAFNLQHVGILGTYHCGKKRHDAFKWRGSYQDVMCICDYLEQVVAIFSNKKYEYCCGNRYISTEVIIFEPFSITQQPSPFLKSDNVSHNIVFHSSLSDDTKQNAVTKSSHSTHVIELIFLNLVTYGRINMVMMINIYVPLHYIYFLCWHMHMLLKLIVVPDTPDIV